MRLAATRSSISAFMSVLGCADTGAASAGTTARATASALSRQAAVLLHRICRSIAFSPSRRSNDDHVGVGCRREQPLHDGLAPLQRHPLVDVALVGDLVAVDR